MQGGVHIGGGAMGKSKKKSHPADEERRKAREKDKKRNAEARKVQREVRAARP